MKEIRQLAAASVLSVLAGLFLAWTFPRDKDRTTVPESVGESFQSAGNVELKSATGSATRAVDDKTILMRRAIAKCDTAGLWDWLRSNRAEGGPWLDVVVTDLVDRQGWQAWSFVQSIENDRQRGKLSEHILAELAERDPWKAYEAWKKSRADFDNPQWGCGVLDFVTTAAALTSGEKMIEVLQQLTAEESESLMTLDFADGFDFEIVLNHLIATKQLPLTVPENLLPEWAEQSPAKAAAWLLENPGFVSVNEHQEYAAHHSIQLIASGKGSVDDRHAALEIVSRMPAALIDRAWDVIAGSSGGKIDAETLDSAGYLKRRDRYLTQALLETKASDTLDESWNQVPLEERTKLLQQADQAWKQKQVSPVENRVHERWLERATTAWGITP